MEDLLSFERFERIIKIIQEFDSKQSRVSEFFEKELIDTWCLFTYGDSIAETLVKMLADEYNCWHGTPQTSIEFKDGQFLSVPSENRGKRWWEAQGYYNVNNDIEWWLYECFDDKKVIEIDGVKHDLTDIKKFHEFLLAQMSNPV